MNLPPDIIGTFTKLPSAICREVYLAMKSPSTVGLKEVNEAPFEAVVVPLMMPFSVSKGTERRHSSELKVVLQPA